MALRFHIKSGDNSPSLLFRLNPTVDLTDAVVKFSMKLRSGAVLINLQDASIEGDPTEGVLRYDWSSGDTDTPGVYDAEFEITYPGNRVETWPNYGYIEVVITADLD